MDGLTMNGIKLHIKGRELIEHFNTRAKYHGGRADIYQSKIKEIEALRSSSDDVTKSISKSMSNSDPVDSLENSFKTHQAKARFFAFAATHVLEDMVYIADISDLTTFEVVSTQIRSY
jgi:hypothetical protein